MKNFFQSVRLALVMVLIPLLFGCGGGKVDPVNAAPVAVAIPENSVSLGAGETYQFTATVTGHSNTAVTWSLSGCTGAACGTITPTGFYTAPSLIPTEATVRITATSKADPTKFDSVAVHHMCVAVSIAPPGATVIPGATLSVTAAVQHDINHAGVTWALGPACSGTCGTLSNVTPSSVTYTAPATVPNPPTVTLTATSITDPNETAEVNITVSVTGTLAEGDYAFVFNGWEIRTTQPGYYVPLGVTAAGHFHADANGNITNGVEDINLESGVSKSVPFTGSYSVGSDRRGSFTITTAQGATTYRMTVDASGSKGKFIKFDAAPIGAPISGTGYFELQDKAAFSLTALAGDYAMGMSGTAIANRIAAVGRFTVDTAGAFSSGKMDVTLQTHIGVDPQVSSTNLTLAGSFSAPSPSTGRGTAALALSPAPSGVTGNLNFAYYVISDEKILLVQTDTRGSAVPVLSGEVRRQNGSFSATSFVGPAIFSMTGVNRANYGAEIVHAAVGQMVSDGSGSVTGTIDDNGGQYQGTMNKAFTGSYSEDPSGRSTMALQLGPGTTDSEIAYFFGPNEAFLMQTSGTDVLFGSLKPQSAGAFTFASVAGTFPTATAAPASEQAENDCGLTSFDGVGGITLTMDVNSDSVRDPQDWLHHFDFTGTYTVAANGRGTLTSAPIRPIVFWIISPTELVGMGAVDPSSPWSALLEYEK
ncbi:MAG: hypothetical protein LAO22_20300 [Acidobacteriia bacterium]|nr:hypothetical protein [Terriglobia bacterium]